MYMQLAPHTFLKFRVRKKNEKKMGINKCVGYQGMKHILNTKLSSKVIRIMGCGTQKIFNEGDTKDFRKIGRV